MGIDTPTTIATPEQPRALQQPEPPKDQLRQRNAGQQYFHEARHDQQPSAGEQYYQELRRGLHDDRHEQQADQQPSAGEQYYQESRRGLHDDRHEQQADQQPSAGEQYYQESRRGLHDDRHEQQADHGRTALASSVHEQLDNEVQHATTLTGYELDEPFFTVIEPFRLVFIEESGKFHDIAPKLWQRFHNFILPSMPTQRPLVGAIFPDPSGGDEKPKTAAAAGRYRAGAIVDSHILVQNEVHGTHINEDIVSGPYLKFVMHGPHKCLGDAWRAAFEKACETSGAGNLELDLRPCLEIYISVPHGNGTDDKCVTELLLPVSHAETDDQFPRELEDGTIGDGTTNSSSRFSQEY